MEIVIGGKCYLFYRVDHFGPFFKYSCFAKWMLALWAFKVPYFSDLDLKLAEVFRLLFWHTY